MYNGNVRRYPLHVCKFKRESKIFFHAAIIDNKMRHADFEVILKKLKSRKTSVNFIVQFKTFFIGFEPLKPFPDNLKPYNAFIA